MSDQAQATQPLPRHDLAPTASPGSTAQFGVMLFLASDVMLFAPFFAAYFLLREANQPWPPAGVELDTWRALLATVVLVASSFTLVASDRAAARAGGGQVMRRWLLVTIALGAAFVANQLAEYATLDFGADDHTYGSIYWVLTGLHGAHVTAGLAAMAMLYVRTVRAPSAAAIAPWTHGVSLFWHLVDLIWLFLFATVWVLR
ncbi:MAG: cytochrome c oxidase subunit 3 [Actinomycetota bacterium]|nr:heme-copper oxidase subunit III [Acidimicrobiia bacterium]MDQ3470477.1 cytochrome c oxidase subunit 3 [Actinomycetota bacterium]